MPRIEQAAIYVDLVKTLAKGAVARPLLMNRFPEPNEQDVPTFNPIEIVIADCGAAGLGTTTRVDVTTVGQGTVAAFIEGTGFDATYSAGSSFAAYASPLSGVNDEQKIQLVRATPWVSQETVTVRVRAATADSVSTDVTYSFVVEDTTLPSIISVATAGLNVLNVTFSEPILQDSSVYSSLRVREISGRVTPTAPRFIQAEKGNFTTSSEDDFIVITGATNALNNSYFEIASTLDSEDVTTVEQSIVTEDASLDSFAWTGPYKLVPIMEESLLIPTYTPAITSAVAIDPQTVQLTLDQQLSPGRSYTLVAHNIGDLELVTNVTPEMTCDFTAEPLPVIAGRRMRLWEDLTPDVNKRDDSSGDNERLVRCFDEVTQLILNDVDLFGNILDIPSTQSDVLDPLLVSLGNPFSFLDDDLTKRKAIDILVQTFKDAGITRGIQNAVQFFLGIPVVVQPFNLLDGWILGISSLGYDTTLGTSVQFLIFSFEIVSQTTLTDQQRAIITEITNVIKPAHTHFVRFVEP